MKIIKKNIVNLMLIIATCTIFSMASASEINTAKTASQYKVTTQSSPAVKMEHLIKNDSLYQMLVMLNSTVPELSRSATQATTINLQNESLAEIKKMNSQIQVTNLILLKTLKEMQEVKKGASK